MRSNFLLLAFGVLGIATAQTQTGPQPTLDTGLPNLYYPTVPPIITGATSTDPLLISPPPGSEINHRETSSTACPTLSSTVPPCVLTSQYNNARQNANLNEPILSSSNVNTGTFGNVKAKFQVDTSGLPTGYTHNHIYAQPLYVYQLSSTQNALFVATLNGEVYAFDADNMTTPTIIWARDETQINGAQRT